jgi:DNA-directed RNA polymerase alpha subunit
MMMSSKLAQLNDYRKTKTRARVFNALDHLYWEVLTRLEDEAGRIDPEEMEEFLVQVLGDHLVGDLESMREVNQLDENYRRFDSRLRKCLHHKILSLGRFEGIWSR